MIYGWTKPEADVDDHGDYYVSWQWDLDHVLLEESELKYLLDLINTFRAEKLNAKQESETKETRESREERVSP